MKRILNFWAILPLVAFGMMVPDPRPAAANDASAGPTTTPQRFTRLIPVAPKIVESSEAYPGDRFMAKHLIDGDARTEYATNNAGTTTYVEFDFGRTIVLAAFQHVDRSDPATVAASELIFKDATGKSITAQTVTHAGKSEGRTVVLLPAPVTAKQVRWQVTGLGSRKLGTVGGAEISFFSLAEAEPTPAKTKIEAAPLSVLERKAAARVQPVRIALDYPYAEPVDAIVRIEGAPPLPLHLAFGSHTVEAAVPVVDSDCTAQLTLEVAGKTVIERELQLKPVRKAVIYILPHSHVDIGYTELQTDVERKQMANIARGIELARATADYPEGARYKWNVEVLWAVESYLRNSPPEKQQEFIDAVHKGWVALDAMYGNELTGLCRPEELLRLFSYATRLSQRCGVPIESAMISDVPGYTWGTVAAMAQAGVKYWSIGPNYFDRMGYTIVNWENKPFYWVGPSGKEKVLCWVPYQGYAISHILRSNLTPKFLFDLMAHLDKTGYPYDILHLRWSGHGDNAAPDEKIPDFVRSWNERYDYPRLVIATTSEAFREFERCYGEKLPIFRGDWTPYWEDGAGSSAQETAINRASAERLTQAETLWALLDPKHFPAADFQDAWRNVLLYSEHTWGAHNSVTEPEKQFVHDQWKIKQAFALDGEKQSLKLLQAVFGPAQSSTNVKGIDVFNAASWRRTELVTLSKELSAAGDRVTTADGEPVLSQRLSSGELVFFATAVPGFGAKRFTISAGQPVQNARATVAARENTLDNGILSVRLDPRSGTIVELRAKGIEHNLADTTSIALNDYLFVAGSDTKNPLHSGPVKISVKERGPLVASLLVESDAPGCNRLTREVRLISGMDYVEISNVVDKKRALVRGKPGDWQHAGHEAKEGVHFGFAFKVPDGVMRMDIPWAVARPELDQLPGACKNWFTVQRWVDISNGQYGATWATIDAPLVEVGALTANLLGSQTNPKAWINHLEPSQTFYSWVMNNHWHTNYRAYQEGPTTFRYAIQPHAAFKPEAAARFGTSLSQPLIVAVAGEKKLPEPLLQVEPASVLVTALKPSDDGKAWIVRLFGASGESVKATLKWAQPGPKAVWLSNLSEKAVQKVDGPIDVPAYGIVTLRADRPE